MAPNMSGEESENCGSVNAMEVLLTNISFSNDPSTSFYLLGERDLHDGPWRGHRFDILPRSEYHEALIKCDWCAEKSVACPRWDDAGMKVKEKIGRLWDCSMMRTFPSGFKIGPDYIPTGLRS